MSDAPDRLLVDEKTAATMLSLSRKSLWTLRSRGVLPYIQIGRGRRPLVRYALRDLEDWIEQQKSSPRPAVQRRLGA